MTCGCQKDENLIKKSVQKVRKIWSKTGSPKVHILTLKASLEPSFFGIPENRCVKRPRLRSMCPPLISRPQKSLKFRTNEGRTDISFSSLTNGKALRAIRLDCGDVGPEMRWFAIDIAIFEFRLAVWWAWTVRKRCQSLWARPGSPPSWGSKLRRDSQIDNFLIWFDGVTECDWLFSCSFYGLIGFIGLWGVFGWSILHLAIQLLRNG